MEKVILFGMGKMYNRYFTEIKKRFDIVAVSDNDLKKEENDKLYIKPQDIKNIDCDYVLICCLKYEEVYKQLLNFGIEESKIKYAQRFLWELEKNEYDLISSSVSKTSVTDQFEYPSLCETAAENAEIFNMFRRSVIYRDVVETVTQSLGEECLKIINGREKYCFNYDEWKRFQKNDQYGDPIVYEYQIKERKFNLSPTTVRYVKILQDILCMFDYKQIKSVAEIGVGYGGQARLITEYLDIQDYYLIDLPPVIKLADVYLGKFLGGGVDGRFHFCDGTSPIEIREYDLFISNYAFSELIRPVQEMYMNSVISHCKSGYILWNKLSNDLYGGYSVEELLDIIPNSKVLDESPLSYSGNQLIVWEI